MTSYCDEDIRGPIVELDFDRHVHAVREDVHALELKDFMVLGPFVMETPGLFETEYFHQRNFVLEEDYLTAAGGERDHVPWLHRPVTNRHEGPSTLRWSPSCLRWGMLRFDAEGSDFHTALYKTLQRNCVYYAAVYIRCSEVRRAILVFENSGGHLYLNGSLLHRHPYGRVNALPTLGHAIPVRFREGRNLLMFKLRPGFIADTIDLSMTVCSLHPITVEAGGVALSQFLPTTAHAGSPDRPLQVFQGFAVPLPGAGEAVAELTATLDGAGGVLCRQALGPLTPGSYRTVRMEVPTDRRRCELRLELESEGECAVAPLSLVTTPSSGFRGRSHLISSFHFDTTYHQEQHVYALGAFWITRQLLQRIEEEKAFRTVLSELDYLHPYYSLYAGHRAILRQGFAAGRIEADSFYNQPNELTSGAEALVRNAVYGQLYHRDVFGRAVSVYSPHDVFGHPNQMSQLCRLAGCGFARWSKLVWGLDQVFRHMSPDGTVLIHEKGLGERDAMRLGLSTCLADTAALRNIPTWPADEALDWMEETLNRTRYSTPSEIAAAIVHEVETQADTTRVALSSQDLTRHHLGVMLTRTDLKQANRLAENLLIAAEKLATIAALHGAQYPDKALDKAWRQLLCGQHHDSITGTNNEVSHVDLLIQYREACELGAELVRRSMTFLAALIRPSDAAGDALLEACVFNTHSWARRDVAEIELPAELVGSSYALLDSRGEAVPLQRTASGERLVFVAELPSFGYQQYRLCAWPNSQGDPPAAPVSETELRDACTISNEYWTITVDPKRGGGIFSLWDRLRQRELIDQESPFGPAHCLAILREVPDRMEPQHELYTSGHKLFSSDYTAAVSCETGQVYSRLLIRVQVGTVARIRQSITLYRGVKRIELQTIVEDYQDRDDLFCVIFPMDLPRSQPLYDDRFSPHVAGCSPRPLSFQTHQFASPSRSRVLPVNQWLNLGPTSQIVFPRPALSDRADDDTAALNLGPAAIIRVEQPAQRQAAEELLGGLTRRTIPVLQFPDHRQSGRHKYVHFNEALDHTDTRLVLAIAGDGNQYADDLLERCDERALKCCRNALAEQGLATLYFTDVENAYKKEIAVILLLTADAAALRKAVKDFCRQLRDDGRVVIENAILVDPVAPSDDYGVALLNRGNISCSVEGRSLLNLMLFHTADFYGNAGRVTGRGQLIPEQKTHAFSYALLPHADDIRPGDLYREAYAFNDPPLVYQKLPADHENTERMQRNSLPAAMSWLETSPDWILTSLHLSGWPFASLRGRAGTVSERGITVRGFEPNGDDARVTLASALPLRDPVAVNFLGDPVDADAGMARISAQPGDMPTMYRFVAGPQQIQTWQFALGAELWQQAAEVRLGPERELHEPTYVRSWEYNLGSMPMGMLSLCGSIEREVLDFSSGQTQLKINIVNNYTDCAVAGVMKLELPGGFRTACDEIAYDLAPQSEAVRLVPVERTAEPPVGAFRLRYEHDGQTFEDIMALAPTLPECSVHLTADRLVIYLNNPSAIRQSGELAIASPYESWALMGFNRDSWCDLPRHSISFSLRPGESRSWTIPLVLRREPWLDGLVPSIWVAVKIMVNGLLAYAYDNIQGEPHTVWMHEYYDTIREENGSLRGLLEM